MFNYSKFSDQSSMKKWINDQPDDIRIDPRSIYGCMVAKWAQKCGMENPICSYYSIVNYGRTAKDDRYYPVPQFMINFQDRMFASSHRYPNMKEIKRIFSDVQV